MGANLPFGLAAAGAGAHGMMVGRQQADEHNKLMQMMELANAREGREASAFPTQQAAAKAALEGELSRNKFQADSYQDRLSTSHNQAVSSDPNRKASADFSSGVKTFLGKYSNAILPGQFSSEQEYLGRMGVSRLNQDSRNEALKQRYDAAAKKALAVHTKSNRIEHHEKQSKIAEERAQAAEAALNAHDRKNEILKEKDLFDEKKDLPIRKELEQKAIERRMAAEKIFKEYEKIVHEEDGGSDGLAPSELGQQPFSASSDILDEDWTP